MHTLDSKIKSLAVDCAYSFKGLYKQSDIKEKYTSILIFIPIIYSITLLVFPEVAEAKIGKIMAIVTLVFSILILVGNKSTENILKYREIASQYKNIYDKLFLLFSNPEVTIEEIESLQERKNDLNILTSQYPIGLLARIIAKFTIKSEMNIKWLGKNA